MTEEPYSPFAVLGDLRKYLVSCQYERIIKKATRPLHENPLLCDVVFIADRAGDGISGLRQEQVVACLDIASLAEDIKHVFGVTRVSLAGVTGKQELFGRQGIDALIAGKELTPKQIEWFRDALGRVRERIKSGLPQEQRWAWKGSHRSGYSGRLCT